MPTANNAAGDLRHTPALVQGDSVQSGLTKLIDLATTMPAPDDVAAAHATGVVSVLGQLAVCDMAACDKIAEGAAASARRKNTLVGIESVLLSALLGSSNSREIQDAAAEAWQYFAGDAPGAELLPVLDPRTGELVFLQRDELESLTSLALREQVAALALNGAVSPGPDDSATEFAEAVLRAASAVASLAVTEDLPAGHELKRTLQAVLPEGTGAPNLSTTLPRGVAVLVDLMLIGDVDAKVPTPPEWKSLWPRIHRIPPQDPGNALESAYWKRRMLCPALPVTGSGLAGQVLHRGATMVLQSLPKVNALGTITTHGFYPPVEAGAPAAEVAVNWRRVARTAHLLRAGPNRAVSQGFVAFVGAHETDPLTGRLIDPDTHQPIPGTGPDTSAREVAARLRATVRSARMTRDTPVAEVVRRLVEIDYGIRAPGPGRALDDLVQG